MAALFKLAPGLPIRIDQAEHQEHIRQQQTLSGDDFAAWTDKRMGDLAAVDDAVRRQLETLATETIEAIEIERQERAIAVRRFDGAIEKQLSFLGRITSMLSPALPAAPPEPTPEPPAKPLPVSITPRTPPPIRRPNAGRPSSRRRYDE